MSQIVVDASIAIKWFLPEIHFEAARRLLRGGLGLIAPDLMFAEVGSALWKKWRGGEVDHEIAAGVLRDLRRFPLQIYASASLLDSAWNMAEVFQRSFYDSLYLALAKDRACQLATADLKLFNALNGRPWAPEMLWVEEIP